jgi:RNA recognition motif-containing protein
MNQDEPKSKHQIFVTKLPLSVTKKEIEDLFDRYGTIVEVSIKKNFAFVVITLTTGIRSKGAR